MEALDKCLDRKGAVREVDVAGIVYMGQLPKF
jgi:hypothetical protein